MMKRKLIMGALLIGLLPAAAQADFIHTDWKVAGDKKASLDEQTGKEWLKLTHTNTLSLGYVSTLLETTYKGWRLPTAAEVSVMFRNLMGAPHGDPDKATAGNVYRSVSSDLAARAVEFMGSTYSNSYAYGWYEPDNGGAHVSGGGLWAGSFYSNWDYSTSQRQTGRSSTGVYLVSDGGTTLSSINNPNLNINNPDAPVNNPVADVSAPAGIAVAGLGLLIAGFRRKFIL